MKLCEETGLKRCSSCKEELPPSKFRKNKSTSDGLQYQCKECRARYEGRYDVQRAALRHRMKSHGSSVAEYDSLLLSQGGCCAICGAATPGNGNTNWCIDHDHDNGKVRGLLCVKCNPGLGFFQDDVGLLQKAIAYLRLHQ